MNDYNFGNFVCMLRENKGLTQQEVADMLGVTAAAVSKWENGSSKPRVEVLFQLAKILDVRAEELMAGRFLDEESISAEALRLINERYEYLSKIESYDSTSVKFKRLVSSAIDFIIAGVFVYFITLLAYKIAENAGVNSGSEATITILTLWISAFLAFGLRDLIGCGKSLGKRIMRLAILDMKTGEDIGHKRKILRNIPSVAIVFLSPTVTLIDALIMITRGRTIGDSFANAVVVEARPHRKDSNCKGNYAENSLADANNEEPAVRHNSVSVPQFDFQKINAYKAPVASKNRIAIVAMCIGVVIVVLMFATIMVFAMMGFDTFTDIVNSFKYTDEMIEYMKNTPRNENVAYVDEAYNIYAHGKSIYRRDEIIKILYLTADHIFYVTDEDVGKKEFANVYKSNYDFSQTELILSYEVDVFMIYMPDEDKIYYNLNGSQEKEGYYIKHISEDRIEEITEEKYKTSWNENDYYVFDYIKDGNEITKIEITNKLTGEKKLIDDEDKKEILKIEQAKKLNEYTDIGYKTIVLKGDEIYLACYHFSIITLYLYDFETEQFEFVDWNSSDLLSIDEIYIF